MQKNKSIGLIFLVIHTFIHTGCTQLPLYPMLPCCPPESCAPKSVNVALVLSGGGS